MAEAFSFLFGRMGRGFMRLWKRDRACAIHKKRRKFVEVKLKKWGKIDCYKNRKVIEYIIIYIFQPSEGYSRWAKLQKK